jgi:hypothetical protein
VILAVDETCASLLLQNVASSTVEVFQFETHGASEPSSVTKESANYTTDSFILDVVPGVRVPAQFDFFLLLFRKPTAAPPTVITRVVHF